MFNYCAVYPGQGKRDCKRDFFLISRIFVQVKKKFNINVYEIF